MVNTSDAARELAAQRKTVTVTCPICGTVSEGIGRKTYCTERCAHIAAKREYRKRQKAKLTQVGTAPGQPVGDEDLAHVVEA